MLILAGLPAVAADKADLAITRIALFSSGVGYFECDATVTGDAQAELKFRTDQINDIIKSMVVQDFGGGKIGVISYASQDPIEKALRSFGVDLTGKPTLAQLLDQLRGEPVEITGAAHHQGHDRRRRAIADHQPGRQDAPDDRAAHAADRHRPGTG